MRFVLTAGPTSCRRHDAGVDFSPLVFGFRGPARAVGVIAHRRVPFASRAGGVELLAGRCELVAGGGELRGKAAETPTSSAARSTGTTGES